MCMFAHAYVYAEMHDMRVYALITPPPVFFFGVSLSPPPAIPFRNPELDPELTRTIL